MKKFSLNKKFLIKKSDFFNKKIFNNSIKILDISIFFIKNNLKISRIGYIIKKKEVSNSYNRNRIKRIIKELFRLNKNLLPINLDLIVIPNKSIDKKNNFLIFMKLKFLLKKIINHYIN
ncbi:ribonuclease P protein component [endosymbiont of Sipalinus gigas]|uniref:ribonuclease P protein component n=1 Tax=endosymbiont of Sipalinus gigas TaxID=1972134 RepID=UPI000DC715C5|nr:ribonuclease P protein component [endosymbiont of Sipalinus gigas]BBA85384.1 ribonuclease P protein component [endosymbiont of Sipalinus gigas]